VKYPGAEMGGILAYFDAKFLKNRGNECLVVKSIENFWFTTVELPPHKGTEVWAENMEDRFKNQNEK
jgi:hypothetical protein